jgi:hypothetical protein
MHRVLTAGRLPVEQGPGGLSCQHIVLVCLTPFGIHTEVQLFAAQLLVLVAAVYRVCATQLVEPACSSAGPPIHQERHTDDYWRVVQLELCSCSCLPAVLVAAACTGFVQDVHSQVHPALPLGRPGTRKVQAITTTNAELKQFSCLKLPARSGSCGHCCTYRFVHHVNTVS